MPKIQDLKINPADQSVYYQNQSVQMLAQLLASGSGQIPTNFTPPSPYPTFHPSASDRRVNIFWIISLVCSLSAALLAMLVQQWTRAYMRIFQRSSNPLKTARTRLFLFESTKQIPVVAEAAPRLIDVSIMLFFWGLGDVILHIDVAVFFATVVPIAVCVCLYLYFVISPVWNPQSPFRTSFSGFILFFLRRLHRNPYYNRFRGKLVKPTSMEIRQVQYATKEDKGRMDRDVRAIQWLVDIIGSNEMQTLVMAIPGLFNLEWGRNVLKGVVSVDLSTSIVDPQRQPGTVPLSPREGTTVYSVCNSVRHLLKTYSKERDSLDAKERHRRLCVCVETVACLVCCTHVELDFFGEVGEVLSKLGDEEQTKDPLTMKSNPSFTVRWTCLSLVAIWKMVDNKGVQELAKFALDGIGRLQTPYDTIPLTSAQRTDDYLKKAWAAVEDLHQALEPWSQIRTDSRIRDILNGHEESILELERITTEAADVVEEIDWRIPPLQNAMEEATHKLMRHLPGVFFSELKSSTPVMLSEALGSSSVGTTRPLVSPQLIFPGQQIQSLCALGRRLRDIIEGQNAEMHEETLKSLESLHTIRVALRRLNYPMKRLLWRLLDLRDGGGLGFAIELFFLTLRQLSPTPSSSELQIFYTGTFQVITSRWKKSKNLTGTQGILLHLLCDLVIRSRGVFSDFHYPPYIVDMLLDFVGKMVEGHDGKLHHVNDVIHELEDDGHQNRIDHVLRYRALRAICPDRIFDISTP